MAQSFLSSIFGGTPTLPSPQQSQGQSIQGNVGQLGNIGNLTTGTDSISAQGAALPYQMNLPVPDFEIPLDVTVWKGSFQITKVTYDADDPASTSK